MPEIKHNFIGGKMNKDLDERLIPNGQYRDAMNIQVSTSEGSDVGTVQNIMGNSIVPGQDFISDNAVCVGSIADEKNDKLYWFVTDLGEDILSNGNFDNSADGWEGDGAELPASGWSWDSGVVRATDVGQHKSLTQHLSSANVDLGMGLKKIISPGETYTIKVEISNYSGTGDLWPFILDNEHNLTTPDQTNVDFGVLGDGIYTWTLHIAEETFDQQVEFATAYGSNYLGFKNRKDTSFANIHKLNLTIDNISMRRASTSRIIRYDTKKNKVLPVFVDNNNSVLKFDPSKLITGINIIDDMLFWTDNHSEPKKINIPRSIEGTASTGHKNTLIINKAQRINLSQNQTDAEENNITVIRKPPKHPPTIEYTEWGSRDDLKSYAGVIQISDSFSNQNSFINSSLGRIYNFESVNPGDTFSVVIDADEKQNTAFSLEWKVGDQVVLKEFNEGGLAPALPLQDYRIKGTITDWGSNNFVNTDFSMVENGDLSTGTSSVPDNWNINTDRFTWNKALGNIECNGPSLVENNKFRNHITLRDIVPGGNYKIKYTIGPPTNGDPLVGRLYTYLYGSDPNTTPGELGTYDPSGAGIAPQGGYGFYWALGTHGEATTYERTIQFHHYWEPLVSLTEPRGLGNWGNTTNYLNSIVFMVKEDVSQGFGNEMVEFQNNTGSTPGTYVGAGHWLYPGNVSLGILPYTSLFPHTWMTGFASTSTDTLQFDPRYMVFAEFDEYNTINNKSGDWVWMYGVTQDLVSGEEYRIELTVSNMESFGTTERSAFAVNAILGVTGAMGIGTIGVSAGSSAQYHTVMAQATGGDPWAGMGGHVTEDFVATGNGKLNLLAYQATSMTATRGPIGTVTLSLKKMVPNLFNGTISNVSVVDIDETPATVEIKVDSIDGDPPIVSDGKTSLKYIIDLFVQEEKLFEFKFPRFAYRYKYEDGEYSSISPFSEITFKPGVFDYHPKKGYNLGMTNNLKSLLIKDYCKNLPKDVSGVDILYKEEGSPNIYLVDNIKDIYNHDSSYTIERDSIKGGLLASNQLLRPWDNVPKKALAQEVTGNRLIYGNYVQNTDLKDENGEEYKLGLSVKAISKNNQPGTGEKSVKSLRDYQVGVVFSDEYGRETPVITNSNATISLDKGNSSNVNQLVVNIKNEGHPVNVKYYKFFIKDIGGEYYNLAMDRFYDAGDGNIWLAFPSVDRNKIDIDDFLILKKGVGNVIKDPKTEELSNVIKEKAQYKILDIKNEAPNFIKRKETLIASRKHEDGDELFVSSDLPSENDINFSIDYNKIINSSFASLHEEVNKDSAVEYHLSLSNTDTKYVSNRYKITQLFLDDNASEWKVTLEEPFLSEVSSFTNDPSGVNATKITDNTYLNIYRTAIDESASHKFDGRFFVKVHDDNIFKRTLKDKINDTKKEFKGTGVSRKIYSLKTHDSSLRIEKLYDPNGSNRQEQNLAFYKIDNKNDNEGLSYHVLSAKGFAKEYHHKWDIFALQMKIMSSALGTLKSDWFQPQDEAPYHPSDGIEKDYYVWRDYDAYFRGINVNIRNNAIKDRVDSIDIEDNADDKKFQDVWFIDDSNSVATFVNTSFGENWSRQKGWKTWPNHHRSWTSMGLQSWSSTSQLELSFGGVQPVKWSTDSDGWDSDPGFFELDGENLNYSEKESDFINYIAIGSQFKFKEDPTQTVYTITDVDIYNRVRYEDLFGYNGPVKEPWEQLQNQEWNYPNHANERNNYGLTATELFRFQTEALHGIDTGINYNGMLYTNVYPNQLGSSFWSHYAGSVKVQNEKLETEVKRTSDQASAWRVSSFLRPSNYTKNWRIKVDKPFNYYWNPMEDTNAEISGEIPIIIVASASGNNYVETTDLKGSGQNKNILSVGMVLKKYNDGADKELAIPAIVSGIKEDGGAYTIYLKTYDGSKDWGAATTERPDDIASSDDMYFYQYPMNGLSPNAAKNLNFFREGKGFFDTLAGTDSIGYTLEWVEEKASRSEEEILPANPAIWETRVKEQKDFDIYYEASGAIPIKTKLTREDMLDLIPIGSKIEHEGSYSVPWNTLVYDVDPNTEQIILSRQIRIVDDQNTELMTTWAASFSPSIRLFGGCFAGGQKVESKTRGVINIEDLEINEYVKTQKGWSKVYAWHMYTKTTTMDFVVLKHSKGQLILSDLHYIYVNNKLTMAKDVKVNDMIIYKGENIAVTEITRQSSKGIYNPYTINGKIIVNDINCSVYPHCYPIIQHILSRIALVIAYFFPKERNKYYNMTPVDSNSKQLLQGIHKWVYIFGNLIGVTDKAKVNKQLTIEELKNE